MFSFKSKIFTVISFGQLWVKFPAPSPSLIMYVLVHCSIFSPLHTAWHCVFPNNKIKIYGVKKQISLDLCPFSGDILGVWVVWPRSYHDATRFDIHKHTKQYVLV